MISKSGNIVWETTLDEGGSRLLAADGALFVSNLIGVIFRLNGTDGNLQWEMRPQDSDTQISVNFISPVWDGCYLYYLEFGNMTYGIRIVDAANGKTARFVSASDINLGFFDGIAVQGSYMVRQNQIDTYGIKLY